MAGATKAKKVLHSGRHASAIKRARQDVKRTRYNRKYKTQMRDAIKAVRVALAAGELKAAQAALTIAIPTVAKTARRGIMPAGRASRYISRLTLAVNKLAA